MKSSAFTPNRRAVMLGGLGLLALSGCASEPAPQFPELTFTHIPAIILGVAEIQIVNNFRSAGGANNVEGQMPISPAEAMTAWARDRLRANGVSGVAKFVIEDAAVTQSELARTEGLRGAFTTDQADRYDATARATLTLEGVPRVSQAFAEAQVSRSQTVAEDVTLNERNQILFSLTEAVMRDFDPAMANSIRTHLADFIR